MNSDDPQKKFSGLETLREISTIISSVIIAGAGIGITYLYNSKQLEISQKQAEAQIIISKNRELSELIPKLGSPDENLRRFSAISLALYGADAVPALIAALNDPDVNVRVAVVESLNIIGDDAIRDLMNVYGDEKNSINERATALYALGRIPAPNAYELALSVLDDPTAHPDLKKDAVSVMSFLKDNRAQEKLIMLLDEKKNEDELLCQNIIYALGEIKNLQSIDPLIPFINHPNEEIRVQTIWALAKISDEENTTRILEIFSKLETESNELISNAARDAAVLLKRRN